jgi:hypothetical protein
MSQGPSISRGERVFKSKKEKSKLVTGTTRTPRSKPSGRSGSTLRTLFTLALLLFFFIAAYGGFDKLRQSQSSEFELKRQVLNEDLKTTGLPDDENWRDVWITEGESAVIRTNGFFFDIIPDRSVRIERSSSKKLNTWNLKGVINRDRELPWLSYENQKTIEAIRITPIVVDGKGIFTNPFIRIRIRRAYPD